LSEKINIIVVVYEKEINELHLLLKSIDLYFDKNSLRNILITTQESGEELKNNLIEMVENYPNIKDYIKINSQSSLIGKVKNLHGWTIQQLLKIRAADNSEGEHSLVLDCKNHFINYTTSDDFLDSGIPKYKLSSILERFEGDSKSVLNINFVNSYQLFNLDPKNYLESTFGSITPFILKKSIIKEMIVYVEEKFKKDFNELFLYQLKCAEFYMYGAFLHSKRVLNIDYLIEKKRVAILIWESNRRDENYLNWTLGEIAKNNIKIFGVHKKAYENISPLIFLGIVNLWKSKGFFDSYVRELTNKFEIKD